MIPKELLVFLVVGVTTVLVDYASYNLMLWCLDLPVALAKGLAFLAGTVFAFFANKAWTFGHVSSKRGRAWRFALLYASTLAANVLVNAAVLVWFGHLAWSKNAAFLVSTAVSAMLNFLGMKLFVFKSAPLGGMAS